MNPIIGIKLDDTFDAYRAPDGSKLEHLETLSRVNIFVGANNSGKSRLQRLLAGVEKYWIRQATHVRVSQILTSLLFDLCKLYDRKEIHSFSIDESDILKTANILSGYYDTNTFSDSVLANIFNTSKSPNFRGGIVFKEDNSSFGLMTEARTLVDHYFSAIKEEIEQRATEKDEQPEKVYIPILRGLRRLETDQSSWSDRYAARTEADYGPLWKRSKPDIFTGQTFYESLTDHLLGNHEMREAIRRYETFLTQKIFNGQRVTLIPYRKDSVIAIKIGSELERPVHELGDGLQNVIILTYRIFTQLTPAFFFIEEAEMHLHPSLQRKVLEFLLDEEAIHSHHVFFLTTHSNHLLDMTTDYDRVTVFNLSKNLPAATDTDNHMPTFTVTQVDGADSSSLELLGVRNSSVFLVNATIWVEGVTDRLYLRKMLQLYQATLPTNGRNYEEDIHFSFVEYGGANISHWSFDEGGASDEPAEDAAAKINVKRLCGRAFVILDEDGGSKQERKDELSRILGDRLLILPCREIENLLPVGVIQAVTRQYEGEEFSLTGVTEKDYKEEYLGAFIESRFAPNTRKRKTSYAAPSGTIASKVSFCEKALPHISWETLPEYSKDVIEKIYGHIVSQNKS